MLCSDNCTIKTKRSSMLGGMDEEKIINTVKFQFPPGSPRPSWGEIAEFLKTLDSDSTNMETVYQMGDRSVYIKYTTEIAMQDALQQNRDDVLFHYSSGKSVAVRMLLAGVNIQYVRLFDLPPEVDDKVVYSVLGKYGTIHRALRERFPTGHGLDHLFTGVRGIYMEIKSDIPPALVVGKWKAKIYHDGLKDKCFLCQMDGHRRNSCPTVKSTEKREQSKREVTYAEVVEAGSVAVALPNYVDTNEEDVIEIIEEEIAEQQIHLEVEEQEVSKVTSNNMDEMDEEQLKKIDEAAKQLGFGSFRENIAKLSDIIEALPSQPKPTASERRAQFSTSGSTELRPKKSARKSSK